MPEQAMTAKSAAQNKPDITAGEHGQSYRNRLRLTAPIVVLGIIDMSNVLSNVLGGFGQHPI